VEDAGGTGGEKLNEKRGNDRYGDWQCWGLGQGGRGGRICIT